MKKTFILFFLIIFYCCKNNKTKLINNQSIIFTSKKATTISEKELQSWPIYDIEDDTIPGISLANMKKLYLKNKKANPVTIALLDTPVDINHDGIKNNLWINQKEIPNNGKDDDNNGYIDDINGWNFLGNSKGENIIFMNYEYTRILKQFEEIEVDNENLNIDRIKAKKAYNSRMVYAEESLKNAKFSDSIYYAIKNEVHNFLSEKELTHSKLDSISKLKSLKRPSEKSINTYKLFLNEGVDDKFINELVLKAEKRINVLLNKKFNDREILGDNPNNIRDIDYGNENISHNIDLIKHGTLMAGIIASNFGVEELDVIMKNIKIMPVCISGYGDENDKDIALGIRYAVDNGADVINISSSKSFSINQEWVIDALKYAETKNVLVITSSGNDGYNLDLNVNHIYPNDIIYPSHDEVVNNLLVVGASNFLFENNLVHHKTNYGQNTVDIFAPGEQIYTTTAGNNDYTFTSGTSAATAIASKSAAILKSYFPKLKSSELKDVILKSGVKYNIPVQILDSVGNKKNISFNEMSKSGRIINLKNAFELATEMSY